MSEPSNEKGGPKAAPTPSDTLNHALIAVNWRNNYPQLNLLNSLTLQLTPPCQPPRAGFLRPIGPEPPQTHALVVCAARDRCRLVASDR